MRSRPERRQAGREALAAEPSRAADEVWTPTMLTRAQQRELPGIWGGGRGQRRAPGKQVGILPVRRRSPRELSARSPLPFVGGHTQRRLLSSAGRWIAVGAQAVGLNVGRRTWGTVGGPDRVPGWAPCSSRSQVFICGNEVLTSEGSTPRLFQRQQQPWRSAVHVTDRPLRAAKGT